MSFIHHILPLTQHGAKIQSTDMHFFMLQKLKLGRDIHVLWTKILVSKNFLFHFVGLLNLKIHEIVYIWKNPTKIILNHLYKKILPKKKQLFKMVYTSIPRCWAQCTIITGCNRKLVELDLICHFSVLPENGFTTTIIRPLTLLCRKHYSPFLFIHLLKASTQNLHKRDFFFWKASTLNICI